MTTETYDHLMSFGIAGVQVPARKAQELLATQVQLEVVEDALRVEEPVAPALAETREPDLGKVNYVDTVRGDVWRLWQAIVEHPETTPPAQLLDHLDTTWKTAAQTIGADVQEKATQIFAARAQGKAQILAAEAARLATTQGLPATVRWLEILQAACTETHQRLSRELAKETARTTDTTRTTRQQPALETLKEEWNTLLRSEAEEMGEVARRFLLLAGGVLLAGVALWGLEIATTSSLGLATSVLVVVMALHTARPLWRRLRLTRRTTVTAAMLASAYRATSLRSLDEMVKRLAVEYHETVRQHLERLQEAYQQRLALTDARYTALKARRKTLQGTLREAPPTIRVLLRDDALPAWYQQGRMQVPMPDWRQRLTVLPQAPDWEAMEREARQAFAFLREVRAEEELSQLYPSPEARRALLQSLRDAAIGSTPGEALLALDFAVNAGRPPQVHVLVEVDDPQTSTLAQEIRSAWAGAGVGVTIDQTADPTALTLIGLVYGYAMAAQKGWEGIEAAFVTVKAKEGNSIYPVLFPPAAQAEEQP